MITMERIYADMVRCYSHVHNSGNDELRKMACDLEEHMNYIERWFEEHCYAEEEIDEMFEINFYHKES